MVREKIAKPRKFQQNTDVRQHFHPRKLARSIARNSMERRGMTGFNKVHPGTTKSAFSTHWRNEAEVFTK